MPEWGEQLAFLIVGAAIGLVGTALSQLLHIWHEGKLAGWAKLDSTRSSIIKDYIDQGVNLVQVDLARGLGGIGMKAHQFTLAQRMDGDRESQAEVLRQIRQEFFRPDPLAQLAGLARLSTFGGEFQLWGACAYRSIELYSYIATRAASRLAEFPINAAIPQKEWDDISHIAPEGDLFVFTIETGLTVMKDLEYLAMFIRDFQYQSHWGAAFVSEDEDLKEFRKSIKESMTEYERREGAGLLGDAPERPAGGYT